MKKTMYTDRIWTYGHLGCMTVLYKMLYMERVGDDSLKRYCSAAVILSRRTLSHAS